LGGTWRKGRSVGLVATIGREEKTWGGRINSKGERRLKH